MATLEILRHGQSQVQANMEHLGVVHTQGGKTVPLSEKGRRQAHAFGLTRRGTPPPDVLIVTGMLRSEQTAQIAFEAARWEFAPVVCEHFAEQDTGILAHMSDEHIWKHHPEEAKKKQQQGWWFHAAPGGGESWEMVTKRVRKGVDFLRAQHRFHGRQIMLVGHVVATQCTRLVLEGMSPAQLLAIDIGKIPNCSLVAYASSPHSPSGYVLQHPVYHLLPEVAAVS